MGDLTTFIELGFRHITDFKGADHILFLLALAAIYRWRDWRDCVWVATAFTIGHSLTLGLAVTNIVHFPDRVIEFLIPCTIVATVVENVVVRQRGRGLRGGAYRPVLAGVFGLVHGAGFANYLRELFVSDVALPLFGFNVGIELGQLCVLVIAFVVFAVIDRAIAALRDARGWERRWGASPVRIRTVAISAVVFVVAARWAVERAPW